MTYDEWRQTTILMLDFWELSAENKAIILLMIDGLKWRQKNEKQ